MLKTKDNVIIAPKTYESSIELKKYLKAIQSQNINEAFQRYRDAYCRAGGRF